MHHVGQFRSRRVFAAFVFAALSVMAGFVKAPAVKAQPAGITLVNQFTLPGSVRNSDLWGWVDLKTNREYVAVGTWPSVGATVHIVEVTDPLNPSVVATMNGVPAFDMKVWGDYLYLCDGNSSGNDSEIWNISDPSTPTFAGYFPSCHNITIEFGFMFLSFSTTRIYDLGDPENPAFVWSDNLPGGHDITIVDDRMYDFHGSAGTYIYDISNVHTPQPIDTIIGGGVAYHHSGWPTEDGNFLFINDELGSSLTDDISVWDISTVGSPMKVGGYADANATIHNGFRIDDYYYTSFYVAGFRVFDVSNPAAIALDDEYDTSAFTGNGLYEGAWGCYPFSPSGNIFVSDMQNGLFIFNFSGLATGVRDEVPLAMPFELGQNYPNPFNPNTTIEYSLETGDNVRLVIYNAAGQLVRTLVDSYKSAGPQRETWNGNDAGGSQVSSGVYFYRLSVNGRSETRRMTLLK